MPACKPVPPLTNRIIHSRLKERNNYNCKSTHTHEEELLDLDLKVLLLLQFVHHERATRKGIGLRGSQVDQNGQVVDNLAQGWEAQGQAANWIQHLLVANSGLPKCMRCNCTEHQSCPGFPPWFQQCTIAMAKAKSDVYGIYIENLHALRIVQHSTGVSEVSVPEVDLHPSLQCSVGTG